ncbi:AAA family ATPase, partial [Bacillus cereus]|uniref:AAA family ATPase n=1 Tax=Bacillus cereus TaxID=1396 RepID=UPI002111FFB5
HRHRGHTEPLQIALAAPTGKAAARLPESIAEARAELPAQWSELISPERVPPAQTLHRLLEYRFGRFDRNPDHLLPQDVVVVDEMSMVA